jgi:putative FmdB family regulatory protein
MPIYEYRCDSCGFQKEYIQRMSDARLTDCPECKKATFSKMVTAAGFQLKGGGWYVTDFKNGGSNTNASKKTEEKQVDTGGKSESTGSAGSTKSESKGTSGDSAPASTASASAAAPAAASSPATSSSS